VSNRTAGRRWARGKAAEESAIPEQGTGGSGSGAAREPAEKPAKAKDPVAKEQTKAAKEARKQHAQEVKQRAKGEFGRLSPGNVKKYVGLAKVLGPVAAPYLAQAAAAARAALDHQRARKLGVPVDELGRFTGRGAALHARIAGDQQALRDLRSAELGDQDKAEVEKFASAAEARLGDLASAVRAAERIPADRRRSVHHAVASELDRVENDMLRRYRV
jgi:hypothetical protein